MALFSSLKHPVLFPWWLHQFIFPPTVHKGPSRCQHFLLLVFWKTAILSGTPHCGLIASLCLGVTLSIFCVPAGHLRVLSGRGAPTGNWKHVRCQADASP